MSHRLPFFCGLVEVLIQLQDTLTAELGFYYWGPNSLFGRDSLDVLHGWPQGIRRDLQLRRQGQGWQFPVRGVGQLLHDLLCQLLEI